MVLLIAIALWIYIGYVFHRDRSRHEKMEREHKEWFAKAEADHKKFVEMYTASNELMVWAEHLACSNSAEAMVIRSRFRNEAGIEPSYDMIIRALLAQKCKMPGSTAWSGFRCLPGKDIEGRTLSIRFLKWYDKELRANGLPYKLLFLPWDKQVNCIEGIRNTKPIADCFSITSGECFWEPIRAFILAGDPVITKGGSLIS